jgi:hypothetical protein
MGIVIGTPRFANGTPFSTEVPKVTVTEVSRTSARLYELSARFPHS